MVNVKNVDKTKGGIIKNAFVELVSIKLMEYAKFVIRILIILESNASAIMDFMEMDFNVLDAIKAVDSAQVLNRTNVFHAVMLVLLFIVMEDA